MKIKKLSFFLVGIIIIGIIFNFSSMRRVLSEGFNYPIIGIKQSISNSGSNAQKKFSFWSSIRKLRDENSKLSEKILSFQIDHSKISELEYENTLLKKELGFVQEHKDKILIPARIVGREPTSFLDSVIIDKGKDDGVVENMAIISSGALVGQVKDVYANQSKVILITSKDSIILAMLQDSRAKGILRGGISGLVLEDITQDVEYNADESVITSGLDGVIPPGILIGKTGGIRSYSSGLFKNIAVEPVADLSKLEIVFIMK